jgi:ATP-dependent Lon protease
VRNLERQIGTVCRKVATRVAEGKDGTARITAKDLTEYLGKPRFFQEARQRCAIPGVATGLVVTPAGGDISFVEATKMRGRKGLILTGQLGDVMKESAQAALSYVRSKAADLAIDETLFDKTDIHIHVPAGAVPKDGPSAGVTIATALVSLLTGCSVLPDVAMTGEITLRGQVLPIGGVKQKVLAAHRVGMTTVILPARNEPDLDDVPEEIRQTMSFVLAESIDQVFEAALEPGAPTCDSQEAPAADEPEPSPEGEEEEESE